MRQGIPHKLLISIFLIATFATIDAQNKSFNVNQLNGETLTLPYHQNDLTLEYVGIHFDNSDKITYQYKMEGVHEDWVKVGTERTARFNNLPAGKYTFLVKAANADGVWNETPALLNIKVLAPWWWTWWAKLVYILAATTSLFALYQFQLRRTLAAEETRRLLELDEVKTKMYTNITHEFRTPLAVIQGLAEQIEGNDKTRASIQRNSLNLLNLVNQMLDLAKLESNTLSVSMIQGDIITYLSYLMESFQSFAKSKNIRLHFLPKVQNLQMDYDPDKLMKIIANLLSNAIKFTEADGNVYVQVEETKDPASIAIKSLEVLKPKRQLLITIKDTGIGIPKDELPHIFDRFYQVDGSMTRKGDGTGIGLAFANELTKLFNGTIAVESQVGKGSSFQVSLPISNIAAVKNGNATHTLIQEVVKREANTERFADTFTPSTDVPLALIVEDNKDVKAYLATCLDKKYQLAFAADGQEGVDKAIQLIPDIIISDVMMPKKDGYELCQLLKKDIRTSHIPIILLTAKVDIDSKIVGLQKGADAYIAKPFNRAELMVRLEQLILLRSQLQERFASSIPPKAATEAIRGAEKFILEDAFIKKLKKVILTNMGDEKFNSTELTKEIGMSSSQLYRKLKALTDKSPAIFIRSVRLQKANELLQTTTKTITEIGFEVGFKDTAYFSTCFSKEFGKSPREARK